MENVQNQHSPVVLWRAKNYEGILGSWQPCMGYRPYSRFGGNEYIEMVDKWQLDLANDCIIDLQSKLEEALAELSVLRG